MRPCAPLAGRVALHTLDEGAHAAAQGGQIVADLSLAAANLQQHTGAEPVPWPWLLNRHLQIVNGRLDSDWVRLTGQHQQQCLRHQMQAFAIPTKGVPLTGRAHACLASALVLKRKGLALQAQV